MNIPVNEQIIKDFCVKFLEKDFEWLEQEVFRSVMELGRQIMRQCLESLDLVLMSQSDTSIYRNKGFRNKTIKTLLGEVEYTRRMYRLRGDENREDENQKKYVYLLDEYMNLDTIGFISSTLSRLIVYGTTQNHFRNAAESISSLTGLRISHQACWNVTQKAGEMVLREHRKDAVKAKAHAGEGTIVTPILYEEKDGIYLHIQGKDREKSLKGSMEMKVGIAYDGVRKEKTKKGYRRILDNKVAYAGFEKAKEFREKVDGVIGSVYNTKEIKQWILNGDGGGWIRSSQRRDGIYVLDEFHRNKALTEKMNAPELKEIKEEVRGLLYKGEADRVLEILAACKESIEDEKEKQKIQELYDYFLENKEGLIDYRKRGLEIQPTRSKEIHHANLGSMESNIFTLIGNRMKGKRMSWSVNGGNNMAALLCLQHTGRMDRLFNNSAEWHPQEEEEEYPLPLSASQVPERVGKGKLFYKNADLTDSVAYDFLMKIAHGNML